MPGSPDRIPFAGTLSFPSSNPPPTLPPLLPKTQLPSCQCSETPGPERFWSVKRVPVNRLPLNPAGPWARVNISVPESPQRTGLRSF